MPDQLHSTKQKPVIFLAFANDTNRFLRNLTKELQDTRDVLDKAEQAGLCTVVEKSNVSITNILDVFQKNKDRIAIFHYGGHADDYRLLLESAEGGKEAASREGLVSFLSKQTGLKLVFLNGCYTKKHALDLNKVGIPAVIGTSGEIGDENAVGVAVRFYNGIANGFAIKQAWAEAQDDLHIRKGPAAYSGAFSWGLYVNEGAENVYHWNLPDAAGNPLFGLPDIPKETGFPESPFLYLRRYEKEHANVFFGRSFEIRTMCIRITDPTSPPVILLHGQSGVGKSSLLEAGVMPRLEEEHLIRLKRRDPQKGLLATLKEVLDECYPLTGNGESPEHLPLKEKWRRIESKTKKPLTIILDQVEEVYTRGNRSPDFEMVEFLPALKPVFSDPASYPRGKLVLSFRKEYYPEFNRFLGDVALSRSEVFLEPLDKNGIEEVVTAISRNTRLKQRYRDLEVETGLERTIAEEMLKDKDSPIAPVLQILMTNMWLKVITNNSYPAKFSLGMYRGLQDKGIAMADFLRQQMGKLRQWDTGVVDSGLALDILKYHTTGLSTALTRNSNDLKKRYPHCPDLQGVSRKLKELYLLTDGLKKGDTGLAHDTLAPMVIKEYADSGAPGQRAARILDARAMDLNGGDPGIWLNEADLDIVQQGMPGMRILSREEEVLLAESESKKKHRLHLAKRYRRVRIAAVVLLIILTTAAVWQRQSALTRARRDNANYLATRVQLEVEDDPTVALGVAERALNLCGTGMTRGTIQRIYRENNFYKILFKLSREEAVRAFSPDGAHILTSRENGSLELKDRSGKVFANFKGHRGLIMCASFSPDGRQILTGSRDGTARLWDLEGKQLKIFAGHNGWVTAAAFSPDGSHILTGSRDKTVILWSVNGTKSSPFEFHQSTVTAVAFSPDKKHILTGSADRAACLWDLQGNRLSTFPHHHSRLIWVAFAPGSQSVLTASENGTISRWSLQGDQRTDIIHHEKRVYTVDVSRSGHYILTGSADKTVRIWNLEGKLTSVLKGHGQAVTLAAFSANERRVFTTSRDKTLRSWKLKDNALHVFPGHGGPVYSAAFSPDGQSVLTGSQDGAIRFWDVVTGRLKASANYNKSVVSVAFSPRGDFTAAGFEDGALGLWDREGKNVWGVKGHRAAVVSIAFSPDGQRVLTGSYDTTARLWDLQGKQIHEFTGHKHRVTSAVFSPDGQCILTGSYDNTARLWNLKGHQLKVFTDYEYWIVSVAFSPDGQLILTGSSDKSASLWSLEGEKMNRFQGHEGAVKSVGFSPDGRCIFTGSYDRTVCLWDLHGNKLQVFKGHSGPVHSAAFSSDSRYIITASSDKTARLWKIYPLDDFLENGSYQELNSDQLKKYGIEE